MDCIDHGVSSVAGIFHLPQSGAALHQRRGCQFGDAIGNGDRAILGLAWLWRTPLSDNDGGTAVALAALGFHIIRTQWYVANQTNTD